MFKRTPLYEQHKALGAKMVPFAGWEMPVSYKSIIEEHNAVRNSVGIFDIGHMGIVKIEGEDALPLIQQAATNDAAKLPLKRCQYSVLCNENGGTVDDILVYSHPMLYFIITNACNTDKDLAWLKKLAQQFKRAVVGLYDNYCMLSVQGPKARGVVEQALTVGLAEMGRNHTLWWRDIILSGTGYTGEDGVELIAAKSEVEKIWQALIKQGAQPCGLGARDTLRLEAGLPLYGHEYDDKTSPLEAGYAWAVKFDKGAFVGKEALLKQKEAGPVRKLVGLLPEGRAIPRAGDAVFDKGGARPAGKVTSGTFSPTLKRPIALAYIAADLAAAGEEARIEVRGNKIPAKVVAKTFYKR